MKTDFYFKKFDEEIKKNYEIAKLAREKGFDPVSKVEIPLAKTMAEKCVELIATIYPQMSGCGIDKRILELEEEYGKLDPTVFFKIAEEVAKQKFCSFSSLLEAIDAGVRIGFAYTTLGVVASPIEGFTELKLGKTREGKEYFKAYFSGPIRSAGTTASCMVLMIIDYLRELFGYAKYDPNENEVKRYVTENVDYHERVTNLQYFPTEEEMAFLAKNLPIQIEGDPTEQLEVSNYKNLERVSTNNIRGGMCLIFSEGLAQKAAKGFRLLNAAKKNGIKSTGWDFLEKYIELHEKLSSKKSADSDSRPTYIRDLVAGRPIYSHPSRSGGFRFRYGRGRVSGFSAASLHPATMAITDNFIANGTQLKIEKPTKGCAITCCDKIEGPIVKLKNKSVKRLSNFDEAKKIYPFVEEIIYLGDILFPFSDVLNRNYNLLKPGYVEEWWNLELEKAGGKTRDYYEVSLAEAVKLSEDYKIPLHPKYIYFWKEVSKEQFQNLIEWLNCSIVTEGKLVFPFTKLDQEKFVLGKRTLELLGVEHEVTIENVVLSKEEVKMFFVNLGINFNLDNPRGFIIPNYDFSKGGVLEIINAVGKFLIKDKSGDFIGARMGRPEKAKLRKLTGSPNVLFPIGQEGGRLRSLNTACGVGKVKSNFPLFYCKDCKSETIYPCCEKCGKRTEAMFYCPTCKEKMFSKCLEHDRCEKSKYSELDINYYFEDALKKVNLKKEDVPSLVKGVRGTSSEDHIMEHLSKGILRAMFNLQVNKDGTIRYDGTELPVTHFKPCEVGVSVDKIRELGYNKDYLGEELVSETQILELMPHDVILPSCPDSPDERADDVFIKITNFIDELLVRFYNQERFFNISKREDLIGHLGVCMAPHNCAGVICRIIGFSKTQSILASPYMHAAIRRDCDGDEAAVMLLMDVLLNFSRKFLPSHRGGTQDAPLVLNGHIFAGEVDDQILDLEMTDYYPLELYEKAEKREHSSQVSIPTVKSVLKEGKDPFQNIGFTHDTTDFNAGVLCSSYKILGTMQEKVSHQMALVEKLRSVDTADTARLIIERHFLRDLKGNLRKFSMQTFRCVQCNEIYRRPPLKGYCPKCRGKIIFTINEGGIRKYLEPALTLAKTYSLSPYLQQCLEITKRSIDDIFGKELEKQESIEKWF